MALAGQDLTTVDVTSSVPYGCNCVNGTSIIQRLRYEFHENFTSFLNEILADWLAGTHDRACAPNKWKLASKAGASGSPPDSLDA